MRIWEPRVLLFAVICLFLSVVLARALVETSAIAVVAGLIIVSLGLYVIGLVLRFVWDHAVRPLAARHGMVEPTADDFVLAGWSAERAGRAEDALAAYDEALRRKPWDEETAARRAGLVQRCPYLADRAERSEWERLATLDPVEVFNHLGAQASNRKLLLVVAACYRRVEPSPMGDLGRAVVDALEECADDHMLSEEMLRRRFEAITARREAESDSVADARFAVMTSLVLLSYPRLWVEMSLRTMAPAVERAEQVRLLGCVLGPLHGVRVADPAWLTATVVALARQMYESGDFSAMPILADALQDAGCEDAAILSHCRGPGPHVRGCWVVDLILGKE